MSSPALQPEIVVAPDPSALATWTADRVVKIAEQSQQEHGRFSIALSGGSTPRALYETLAAATYRDRLDWSRVQVFFSDERFVAPDSPDSNYHLAWETLLSKVPIPERFVHGVATVDILPREAASNYEEGLRRVFEVGLTDLPRFDLILLGLGPDGHTASLFPDTEALNIRDRLVAENFVPKLDFWRITFTYPLINAADTVMFLVEGAGKADMVRNVVERRADLPAAGVQPTNGRLVWMLDRAAGSDLGQTSTGPISPPQSSSPSQ